MAHVKDVVMVKQLRLMVNLAKVVHAALINNS
jgi:hypothetical protein